MKTLMIIKTTENLSDEINKIITIYYTLKIISPNKYNIQKQYHNQCMFNCHKFVDLN